MGKGGGGLGVWLGGGAALFVPEGRRRRLVAVRKRDLPQRGIGEIGGRALGARHVRVLSDYRAARRRANSQARAS